MGYAISILLIGIVSAALYLLTRWSREYGDIEGLFPLGAVEAPVRTKLPNWRELIGNISFIYVTRIFKDFMAKNRAYYDPALLAKLDLVFTNTDCESGLSCSERKFCYNELGYMYVIKINILRVHKDRVKSDEFAEMLIDEYKKLHAMHYQKSKR